MYPLNTILPFQHMNIEYTTLKEMVIKDINTNIKKSKSLNELHKHQKLYHESTWCLDYINKKSQTTLHQE
jgi:hypothetical protein